MFNLFAALKKDKLWDFKGGIHPPEMKHPSSHVPLRHVSLPPMLIIPLQQHIGQEGELLVKVGQHVMKGQPLTRGSGRNLPVHASTSGVISAISPQVTAHPSGLSEPCVTLIPDNQDRWGELHPVANFQAESPLTLTHLIHQAGIAGLGGAGFPTGNKLEGGYGKVETLIINAAECEPYITADDRLMREHADEIILGCEILGHILTPKRTLIGIEDNKPEAIAALKKALKGHDDIKLRVIPTKYPSGGAKQLTKILTGMEVPFGKHSASIGVLMQNVGTVYAIKRAIINGEPLIERVVTLTGELMKKPGNVWARLGTPVKHLLQAGEFEAQNRTPMVIMGGPLMGFTLAHLSVPIVKISNCILAPSKNEFDEAEEEQACIRCSQCADTCPAGLLPQQLYWFSRGKEHEKARQHHLFDCIECGACAYVCPSSIPLVQYYRQEKAEIKAADQEAARAAQAKERFEARQARLAREKAARELRHKQSAVNVSESDQSAVQAAVARVKQRQEQASGISSIHPFNNEQEDNSIRAAREARKALARERKQEIASDTTAVTANTDVDPRKAAVAAALARVKAKKAAQDSQSSNIAAVNDEAKNIVVPAEASSDPRKAAVAAAIARAKAKKAGLQDGGNQPEEKADAPTEVDPRKAAVAAAIARAKAKKAAQEADTNTVEPSTEDAATEQDPRKAAVAAAIARVKAKQAAQASAAVNED
ncbi:electron transport complex subunit RsxC [Hafnia paralvei]|uniref:Ion-translocating oxidoreductase complex subunit C n=1 Tax=Hafnia paralvei TaxID=546367 RepID=A0A2A2MFC3_9GAMM|nr:electron transport complex subunit RsxC [Hafnia paralvei]KHS47444.1 electron transporter RnfC [Hafnia paralvei]PAV97682.1 electron transport complex subunit RsxC [Hafnia paralvei]TBL51601.1 electron transport complex subunit RsxC [Hafnia paralvei]